jgi:probable DNA repair protein
VSTGLLWLRWLVRDLRASEVGHLLRSPMIGAAGTSGRARLELRLRGLPDRDWSPYMITAAMKGKEEQASDWLQRVAGLTKMRRELPASASPAEWAIRIDGILDAAGWPGQGALSSADFQLLNRWRDLLNDLARMDLVSARMSLDTALVQLESMAGETVFQPETELTQVHLLGPLDACGLEFDAIWLTGMTATDWPARSSAAVLVSRRLQEEHGMPDGTPAETLDHARRLLARLCAAAPEVVCSYPRLLEDAEQTVSELLEELGSKPADAEADPGWHAVQLAGNAPLSTVDDQAPPIDGTERLVGGASTIQAQLNEPAAAFIGGRLAARALDEQASGLPALLRGNLIHDALYKLYLDKPSRDQVADWTDVDERIGVALDFAFARHERNADDVLLRLLAMERQRVGGLLREFLSVDITRGAFVVDSVESKVEFEEAGVRLELRMDRVDRLPDGSVAIIDYKTGAEKTFLTRQGEPKEYQLVAYACAIDETIAELALANVDSRSVVFHGAGAADIEDWPAVLTAWSDRVRGACADMARGDVRLDRRQAADDARPLNLLTRFTERRHEW